MTKKKQPKASDAVAPEKAAAAAVPSTEAKVVGEKETPGAAAAVPSPEEGKGEKAAAATTAAVPIQTPYMLLVNKKLRNIAKQLVSVSQT